MKTVGNIPCGINVPWNWRACEVTSLLRVPVEILSIKNLCCGKPQMIWRSGKLGEGKEITLNIFHEKHLRFPLYVIRRQQWGNIRLVILWCSPANFHWLCNLGTPETLQLLRYQVPRGSSLFYVLATHPAQKHQLSCVGVCYEAILPEDVLPIFWHLCTAHPLGHKPELCAKLGPKTSTSCSRVVNAG